MSPHLRLGLFWFFFPLVLFLLGNGEHAIWDRDEPRYCQATREMITTGDFVIPHFNGGIRYDKPPMTYWLMAGPMSVLGINEFAARFPAAVLGAARTSLVFFFALALGASLSGASVAALAAMMIALLLIVSKAATTDSALVFSVLWSMYAVWLLWSRGFSWLQYASLCAALAFSVLVKGPVGPAIVGLAAATLTLWTRWNSLVDREPASAPLRPARTAALALVGVGIFCLLALPWAILAWVRTDGDFLLHSFQRHVVERVQTPSEGHAGPFFYYAALLPLLLFPFSAIALVAARFACVARNQAAMRFLLCWFIPGVLMFTASSTKLPHYVAPLIPAVALAMGLWWSARERGEALAWAQRQTAWRAAGAGFLILVGIALPAGWLLLANHHGIEAWLEQRGRQADLSLDVKLRTEHLAMLMGPVLAVTLCIAAGMVAGGWFWLKRRDTRALQAWVCCWFLAAVIALVFGLPRVDSLRPSKPLAFWIHNHAPTSTHVIAIEYQEPSFVFYWGNGVEMLGTKEDEELFALLNDTARPAALVTFAERWEKLQKRHGGPTSPAVRLLHQAEYYQFEKGRYVTMVIVGNFTPAAATPAAGI